MQRPKCGGYNLEEINQSSAQFRCNDIIIQLIAIKEAKISFKEAYNLNGGKE